MTAGAKALREADELSEAVVDAEDIVLVAAAERWPPRSGT